MQSRAKIKPATKGGFNVEAGGELMRQRQGTQMQPWLFPTEDAALKHITDICRGFNASFPLNRMTCAVVLWSGEVVEVGGEA